MQHDSLDDLKRAYRLFEFTGVGEPCAYCGVYSTDNEHVIPRSWLAQLKEMEHGGLVVNVPKEIVVRSCHECNLLASSRIFSCFSSKKEFIKQKVARRYRKLLKTPLWSDAELRELRGRLQRIVYASNELAKLVRQRLMNLADPRPIKKL